MLDLLGEIGQFFSRGGKATPALTTQRAFKVGQAAARYQDAVERGNVYIGANLGGTSVTTQAGLSATTPALTLYNPVGSGVYGSLWTVTVDITTSPAAASGLMLAWNLASAAAPTSTTGATLTNAQLGSLKTGAIQCYRIATLAAAPVACRFLGGPTGAASISAAQLIDHVDGAIHIMPGVALSIQATTAAAILAGFVYEEVPLP